ncbi:2OG-Fe(II) oxygenase [Glaciecola siphonariae]|uniref:2OG-Fe(II) oxygenase n=1 Tax=Glaciecola siphonariae TaxID=521012 RepID=A0ABV9LRC4_9ALTE
MTALLKSQKANSNTYACEYDGIEHLFECIAQDILHQGFSVQKKALPLPLADILHYHLTNMPDNKFSDAAIGRQLAQQQNTSIRSDEIAWINGDSPAGTQWLKFTSELQIYLNRRLFLGLFSFESHFAHYAPGRFYKRHVDAFKGEANRVLSLVTYLNKDWNDADGGELVIYQNDKDKSGITVYPEYGTLTFFLSEQYPHEVKPAKRDRYSIAGWFRLNSSTAERVDPPS